MPISVSQQGKALSAASSFSFCPWCTRKAMSRFDRKNRTLYVFLQQSWRKKAAPEAPREQKAPAQEARESLPVPPPPPPQREAPAPAPASASAESSAAAATSVPPPPPVSAWAQPSPKVTSPTKTTVQLHTSAVLCGL